MERPVYWCPSVTSCSWPVRFATLFAILRLPGVWVRPAEPASKPTFALTRWLLNSPNCMKTWRDRRGSPLPEQVPRPGARMALNDQCITPDGLGFPVVVSVERSDSISDE